MQDYFSVREDFFSPGLPVGNHHRDNRDPRMHKNATQWCQNLYFKFIDCSLIVLLQSFMYVVST